MVDAAQPGPLPLVSGRSNGSMGHMKKGPSLELDDPPPRMNGPWVNPQSPFFVTPHLTTRHQDQESVDVPLTGLIDEFIGDVKAR